MTSELGCPITTSLQARSLTSSTTFFRLGNSWKVRRIQQNIASPITQAESKSIWMSGQYTISDPHFRNHHRHTDDRDDSEQGLNRELEVVFLTTAWEFLNFRLLKGFEKGSAETPMRLRYNWDKDLEILILHTKGKLSYPSMKRIETSWSGNRSKLR